MSQVAERVLAFVCSADFLWGALRTVELSVLSTLLGVAGGLPLALLKDAKAPPLRWLVAFFLWAVRGTPVLLQLVLVFNVLPLAGIVLPGFVCAVLVLSLNESAYMAEIFRAGLGAVGRGQRLAAKALGMSDAAVLRKVVLPQAARVVIPPLGNQFIGMLKLTSVVSVIAVPELLLISNQAASASFQYLEALTAAAVYYLALTSILMLVQGRLESWAGRKAQRAATARVRRGGREATIEALDAGRMR
jgi:polar amino acid transport system permease protein